MSRRRRPPHSSKQRSSPPAAGPGRPFLLPALAVLLSIVVYLPSLPNPFVFDDSIAVSENPRVIDFHWTRLLEAGDEPEPGRPARGLFRPLRSLSYALDVALWGLFPPGLRVTNLLLNALCVLLFYLVLLRLTSRSRVSAFSALLFAVHPLHSEAVAYIAGRDELLAALFFFGAWRIHLGSPPPGALPDRPDRAYGRGRAAAVALLYLMALLSKEIAVTLPAALLLSDIHLRREGRGGSEARASRVPWKDFAREGTRRYGLLLSALAVYLVARWEVRGSLAALPLSQWSNPVVGAEGLGKPLTALRAAGRALSLFIYPGPLSVDYSYRAIPVVEGLFTVAGLLVLAGTLIFALATHLLWKRRPLAGLGLLLFAAIYSVVSNLFFPLGSPLAEARLYLPSAGLCLTAGVLGAELLRRAAARSATAAWVVLTLVFLLLAARTSLRCLDYRSESTLFAAAARAVPESAKAHYLLAGALVREDRLEEAEREYRRAAKINPRFAEAANDLGVLLARRGRLEEAEANYLAALSLFPAYPEALYNLANLREELGEYGEAEELYRRALSLRPAYAKAWNNLGLLYAKSGKLPDAEAAWRKAVGFDPGYAIALRNLGLSLLDQGRPREAKNFLGKAAALGSPAPPERLAELKRALMK